MSLPKTNLLNSLLFSLLLAMLGAACGNGDSSADNTPPTVLSTNPADSAVEVALDSQISAKFSEAMDPASIDDLSFSLSGPGGSSVAGTLAYDSVTETATFTPAAALTPGTSYTGVIGTGVKDLTGNALAAEYRWSFTTLPAASDWELIGDQVSPDGAESEDPTMMVIGQSPAVGYRHQSFRSYLHVWDGNSWSSTQPDPTSNQTNSSPYSAPDFCTIGQDVFLAYSHQGESGSSDDAFYERIFVYRWNAGTGWTAQNDGKEVSILYTDPPGGADAWDAAIACPASGNPWVAWTEVDMAPDPDSDTGAWLAEVGPSTASRSTILSRDDSVDAYATDVRVAGVALDQSGHAYVAQYEQDATEQWLTRLYVTRYDGSFVNLGGAIAEDWDSSTLPVPSMVADGSDLYLAYSTANNDDNTREVYVKKYDGSWSTLGSGPLSGFSGTEHFSSNHPDLLMADGKLWAAWQESGLYEGQFIFVAYWDETESSWVLDGDRLNVNADNTAADPSLAYSPVDGMLYLAFEENVDGHPQIFVKAKKIKS